MGRRRQINSEPRGGDGGRLTGLYELARWPFERLAWLLEERVLWPLRETTAGRLPNRRGAAAALVATAAIAAIAVLALLPGAEAPSDRVAQPAKVAIAQAPDPEPAPVAKAKPRRPQTASTQLQGAPPDFSVGPARGLDGTGSSSGSATGSGAGGESGSAPSGDAESESTEDSDGTDSGDAPTAATASGRKPVPPGPRAMRVARRFSEAFVFYEVGKRRDRAEQVFAETATPRLARALRERPPRQPAGDEVPRARVLNLVAGPRAGRAYTVSVSMLRVGLTTELRLELRRDGKRNWLVTDVRG